MSWLTKWLLWGKGAPFWHFVFLEQDHPILKNGVWGLRDGDMEQGGVVLGCLLSAWGAHSRYPKPRL